MVKVYYLVQEIAGPKNEAGSLPPSEGGLGVAALNMLRASKADPLNDVEFKLILPGTQNVLRYFGISHEAANSTNGRLVETRMPFSGEYVLIACHAKLQAVESFSERVRQADGAEYSDVVSKIITGYLDPGDILHLNGWHFYTVAADVKAKSNKNPVILNVHIIRDVYRHQKDGTVVNPWSAVIDYSDVLVPVSRTYARQIVTGSNEPLSDDLCKKIAQKNIYGIGNGYEKAEVYANTDLKSKEMAWIHRIDSRQKGLVMLREVINSMVEAGSVWKLNILGNVDRNDEEAQRFINEVRRLEAIRPDIVRVDTAYSTQKKDEILRRSRIFLCTSLYEGSPYAVMEAMNYGLVSVVTPKAGLLDLIKNGENGFVSPDMSARGFHGAIEKAIEACGGATYSSLVLCAQISVPTPKEMFDSYRELYRACAEYSCEPTRFLDIVRKLNSPTQSTSRLGP